MKRLALFALFCIAAGNLWSQKLSQTTVFAKHPQTQFEVDGKVYTGLATFTWPEGSVHYLRFVITDELIETNNVPTQYLNLRTTRLVFQGWQDDSGISPSTSGLTRVIQSNAAITQYEAVVSVEHLVKLVYFDAGENPSEGCGTLADTAPANAGPGVVFVNNVCYAGNADIWLQPGQYPLFAFPYPGWAFRGWGINNASANAYVPVLVVQAPVILIPYFEPGKRVSFLTEPMGLHILVDRGEIPTPTVTPCEWWEGLPITLPDFAQPLCIGEFDWAMGEKHVLGAPSPQTDQYGRHWVFDGFSNGVGANEEYVVTNLQAETIIGHFTQGGRVSFVTKPTGLALNINGTTKWPGYNFVARPGDVYEVSAPAEQVGPDGRKYVFKSWSNGGEAAQQVTIPATVVADGFRMTAEFELLSQVMISADPAGTPIEVNGESCPTPCSLDGPAGTEYHIVAPQQRTISHAQRLDFQAWSDGGPRDRTLILEGTERKTLSASYRTMYLLETSSIPEGGAKITANPSAADGFYLKGTYVTLTAEANEGYKFRRWVGDLESAYQTGGVTMSVPRSATVMLDEVPFVPEAGVRNAAGETPDMVVASGSIISIYGTKIAPYLEIGPANPLLQTLGGVTVWVNEHVLALLFVSPNQINAILPYGLPPGEYTLVIRRPGQPDINSKFTLVRNAPGLFTRTFAGAQFVLATHEDGTPVTPDSPARRGERIKILGTGFGPYDLVAPYGFPLPATPRYKLVDSVEVFAGSIPLEPEFAGGAAGYSGTDVLEISIDDKLPAASTVEFHVRIGGRDSNTALLPIE